MPADQPRTPIVGCKMTDNEYGRLAAVAEGDGMTLGEWVREVLLERADGRTQTERDRRDAIPHKSSLLSRLVSVAKRKIPR
jgi:hypothetical protein